MLARALLELPHVKDVLTELNARGEETRIIGGAVRNALLDIPVADIDLATTAVPEKIVEMAKAKGWRAIPTGIAHGTVTLLVDGKPYEVTTLRQDLATDGRYAEVEFGRDFAADALRRDFTINALSLSLDGKIHDYAGGLDDLAARHVRFIGDPDARIKEDYLRILRFFRFSSAYEAKQFNAAALTAIIRNRDGLAILSKERVSAELLKTLTTRRAAEVFALMSAMDILPRLLGGIGNPAILARLIDVEASRQTPADAVLRLAALALFSPSDVTRLRDALRLSNADTARLNDMAKAALPLHGANGPPDKGHLREFLFTYGRQAALDGLSLAHAQGAASLDGNDWQTAFTFLRDTPEPQLPFTGADLLAHGLTPGRAVGATLKKLQSLWIRAGFPRDPQSLSRLLDQALQDANPAP